MSKNKQRLRSLAAAGLTAAILCVIAPISVPVGNVPLSLATLVILTAAGLLGSWKSTAAVLVYLVLGCIGLPVFSGFTAGFGQLLGPTGGYLFGYIPLAVIAGLGRRKGAIVRVIFMIIGTVALYTVGTVWYIFYADAPPMAALAVCTLPYIPLDGLKIAVAVAVTGRIK